ncbi:MAG: hypothetical protein A2167_02735 [Planctomycetes bacterium RBG_13_46_10]|nr:MAG: hypothetical protein A2167_02735 [Planctomycetes bacterium RBG_13_46_10]
MNITLDGQMLFDEQDLEIQPSGFNRTSMEKSVPGLNGVLSIDLGQRSREIKQKGTLQAKSSRLLDKRIAAISAFIDGDTHKLVTNAGRQFDNLRMDVFKLYNERISGAGVAVDYEIVYTQLD